MMFSDLLCALRQRLLNAWDRNDQEDLSVLLTTFAVLREEIYVTENGALITVVSTLEEATRNAMMGFKTKGEVPSVETIRAAFSITE
jgi:hypothetical protein